MLDAATLQRLLDPGVKPDAGDWEAQQRAYLPEPSWLQPVKRRHWRAALEAARAVASPAIEVEVNVLPVWWGDNDIDVPERDWRPTLALLADEVKASRLIPDECVDAPIAARARARLAVAPVGRLVRTRDYSSELRVATHGPYAVARHERIVVLALTAIEAVQLAPAPEADVPPYSIQVTPAIPLSDTERTRLRALAEDLGGTLRAG